MTKGEVATMMSAVFSELQELREQGQREYAHDEDNAFRNFESIADRLALSREKVLLTYLFKHLDGITAYVNGHRSQREDVRGRINDAIVYLVLLRAMVEETSNDPRLEGYRRQAITQETEDMLRRVSQGGQILKEDPYDRERS